MIRGVGAMSFTRSRSFSAQLGTRSRITSLTEEEAGVDEEVKKDGYV